MSMQIRCKYNANTNTMQIHCDAKQPFSQCRDQSGGRQRVHAGKQLNQAMRKIKVILNQFI